MSRSSSSSSQPNDRVDTGKKHLAWVPISEMRISERAQRDHNTRDSQLRIAKIAKEFDPDKFGTPDVNLRDGLYYVMDGGHRVLALKLLGWEDQKVQCWLYEGLTEEEEAEFFLSHNADAKQVAGMELFKKALVANRTKQTDIDRIVRAAGMKIGSQQEAIGCIAALTITYDRSPAILCNTVTVLRAAYDYPGFRSKVVEATGLFLSVYENKVDMERLIDRLQKAPGGVNGLLGRANIIRDRYATTVIQAVAASMVEMYNKGTPAKAKLNGWWSTFNGEA